MEDPNEKQPEPLATTIHAQEINPTVQLEEGQADTTALRPKDAVPQINKDKTEEEPPKQEALPVLPTNVRYEGMEEFARGGLGRIVKATDKRLNRPVALKELLKSKGSAEARFLREAYITAGLEHPSIIPVHDAGRWPNGAPFFSMKLVNGKSLKEALDDTKTLRDRLSLLPHLIDTAEAIAYAHSKRIIHRDIKPHNILVGGFGETVVIDWGIAKEMDLTPSPPPSMEGEGEGGEVGEADLTKVGAVMGTPAYMAPEQAAGKPVDERADVYSLGAMLYYFLAGAPPYVGASGKDVLKQVLTTSPRPIAEAEPEAPKDLIAIAEKAMRRDPKDRYRTAKEMAEDLRSYQLGGLVGAHKYTLSELISRWIKKNALTVIVAASLLLLMLVGGIASVVSIVRATRVAEDALKEEEKQRALAQEKQQIAEESSNQLRLLQARDALDRDPAATLAWLKEMSPRASGWSYAKLLAQETQRRGAATNVFRGHSALVHYMAFSPDGSLLASASKDGTLRLWNVSERRDTVLQVSTTAQSTPTEISAAAFSSDGVWLAAADTRGLLRLWKLADIKAGNLEGKAIEGHTLAVTSIEFSPDHKTLATGSTDMLLFAYDLSAGTYTPIGSQESAVKHIKFSAAGDVLASTGQDGSVVLWNLASRAPTKLAGVVLPDIPVRFLAKEEKLIGATPTGVLLWSLRDPIAAPISLPVEGETPTHIEVSGDGRWLAIAGQAGRVRLWSFVEKSWRLLDVGEAGEAVEELRFSSDGATLAVASGDKLVWLWDTSTGVGHALKGHVGGVKTLAFSPDGDTLASVCDYNAVRFWDTASGAEFGATLWMGHDGVVSDMAATKDEEWLFSVDAAGGVWEHNTKTGAGALVTRSSTLLYAVAVSPDQKTLAFAGKDTEIRLLDRESGQIQSLKGHSDVVRALEFSPDGKFLASGSADATLLFWELTTKTPKNRGWFLEGVNDIAFSPGGEYIAIAAQDRSTHLLELSTNKLTRLQTHLDFVSAVAFSADGKWFASASLDKSIRVFMVEELFREGAKPSFSLDGHSSRVNRISFSTDGSQLLSTSDDHTTRLWDLKSAQHVVVQDASTQGFAALYLQKSERLVASLTQNELVVWPNPKLPDDPTAFIEWLSTATTAKVGKDYKLRSNQ